MPKQLTVITILMMTFMTISQSCQNDKELTPVEYEINFVPAKTNSELFELSKNPRANIIRDIVQLDYIIANKLSPLSKLSNEDITIFKQNLPKGKYGFGSIYVGILKKNLSTDDYHKVMAMFGLDTKDGFWGSANNNARTSSDGQGKDYAYRECDGKHNCVSVRQDIICTSNC